MIKLLSVFLVILSFTIPLMASEHSRIINKQVTVNASIDKVWEAWTTSEGIKSFFAPDCRIDLKVGGAYEMYFIPDAEPGSRGGEGVKILALQPPNMLSFTWNAPPHLPNVRKQFTHVTVKLTPEGDNTTRVLLTHDGWGDGEEWDKAFEYFDGVWEQVVLQRLIYLFSVGPIDWDNPPPM
ncbi:SRPBCC domain-containing protein [candidate division KSB1 bacterium]|nr:SRPBCC domain-containing protein [candidate division KSB1 bacterium]